MDKERRYLMAVSIYRGVIRLIDESGSIVNYAQRGIKKLNIEQKNKALAYGMLCPEALVLKELPNNISIYYEDESIMGGKPRVTFDANKLNKI